MAKFDQGEFRKPLLEARVLDILLEHGPEGLKMCAIFIALFPITEGDIFSVKSILF